MDSTIFLAQLMGPALVLISLAAFANRKMFTELVTDLTKSAGLYYCSAMTAMVAGTAIVLVHNTWMSNWTVLITVIGWLAIVKGVVRLLAPEWSKSSMTRMVKNTNAMNLSFGLTLVIGLMFCFFGYMV